jgi:hypothetical protein
VRNDPFLEQGPKVMHRYLLTDGNMQELCSRYRVAYFDKRAGVAYGIPRSTGDASFAGQKALTQADMQSRLKPPPCGRLVAFPAGTHP